MTLEEIINYCLSKPEAYVDFPFGDIPMCIKVKKETIRTDFPEKHDFKITLNCDKDNRRILPEQISRYSDKGLSLPAPGSAVFQHDPA